MIIFSNLINVNNIILQKELKHNNNLIFIPIQYKYDSIKKEKEQLQLNKFDHYLVPIGHWHQITNPSKVKTHIIEIQYGEDCIESDIERFD